MPLWWVPSLKLASPWQCSAAIASAVPAGWQNEASVRQARENAGDFTLAVTVLEIMD